MKPIALLFLFSLFGFVGCTTTVATPDLPATVTAAVEAALPTIAPTLTPNIKATIEARLQATLAAVPTPTSTPLPTLAPTPTPTPIPTPTAQPTATPAPTATSTPTSTATPVPPPTPTPTPAPARLFILTTKVYPQEAADAGAKVTGAGSYSKGAEVKVTVTPETSCVGVTIIISIAGKQRRQTKLVKYVFSQWEGVARQQDTTAWVIMSRDRTVSVKYTGEKC